MTGQEYKQIGTFDSAAVAGGVQPKPVMREIKVCCNCGMNVTRRKRLKDSQGRYWCNKCGVRDQAKKGQGIGTICPDCERVFPPAALSKWEDKYVCEKCYEVRRAKAKPREGSMGGAFGGPLLVKLCAGAILTALGTLLISANLDAIRSLLR